MLRKISAIIGVILIVFALAMGIRRHPQSISPISLPKETSSEASSSAPEPVPTKNFTFFTEQELKKHATDGDCWVSIDGKVYDVSSYADLHPGGKKKVLAHCGTDASAVFDAKHGSSVLKKLEIYRIGTVAVTTVPPEGD
ncbi:MAG: cytochrome b5-like heme/steroid binding domain-containing protein [Candidatus Peregrinibacteria bacterium]